MRSHDPLLYSISAPIPVPGTQQEPTVPPVLALSSIGGTHILSASGSSRDHEGHSNNRSSSNSLITLGVVGQNSNYLANTLLVGPPRHRSHYSGNSNNNPNTNPNNDSHTISHNKALINVNHNNPNNINSGLRFPSLIGGASKKLTAENTALRAKITELERYLTGLKEELLLARAQIRVKNDEAKLSQNRKAVELHELAQHIQRYEVDLLAKSAECEALQNKLQYQTKEQMSKLKRITLLENELLDYKRVSSLSSSGGINSAALRISRNSSNLSESARSSTVLPASGNAGAFSSEEALIQIRQLKDENARKDEQLEELMGMVEKLKANVSQLEKQQSTARNSVSTSNSGASFDTAMVARSNSKGPSSVNSVGYDASAEHPKLLVRYQALRMQHAQASEYLEILESENNELRAELLDISSSFSSTQAADSPRGNSSDSTDPLQPMATIAPTSSTNSLHHPKASTLAPLDLDNLSTDTFWTPASTVTPSPTSAITSSGSPSTAVAPALTRKSSLRYSRDGLLLPTLASS
ncbi:hypothetical protein BGZ80_005477 [Entomortierella chlamydospora]|uniref:Uncharacterized protein n=1 Tax=Entomortierella chlamydospora TaxID=101097 RepID=A0A9P6N578_9FUNG|nr:hypothetical protein BGZ80_005477 [Entomortierella chlamydospora]